MQHPMVQAEPVIELGNLLFIGRALFGFLVDLGVGFMQRFKVGFEFVKGVIALTFLSQPGKAEVVGKFDFENGIAVRQFRAHGEVH